MGVPQVEDLAGGRNFTTWRNSIPRNVDISTHQIQRNNKARKGEKTTYRRVECVRTRLLDICK
jgi:hypothetical protein